MALSEEEKRELAELEQGLSQGEAAELAALEAELKSKTGVVQGALRALDYDRAVSGGPVLAKILGAVSGKPVTKEGEFEKAAKFEADYPSSLELLERAGYAPEGKISRFLVGTGLDIATAPSTYATFGASALSKLGKAGEGLKALLTPTKSAAKSIGESTWKSAFKQLDIEAAKQGKKIMPSDVLVEGGVSGLRAKTLNKKMGDLSTALFNERENILKQATDAGGKIDVDLATKYAREMADQYRALDLDQADEIAKALDSEIASFERLRPAPAVPDQVIPDQVVRELRPTDLTPTERVIPGRVIPGTPARPGTSPARASDIKTFFYKGVPSSQWAPYAQTAAGTELNKALAKGLKEATEESVEKTVGKGTELKTLNDKLGSLLSSRKKELGEVGKEEAKDLFTSVDGLTLTALLASGANPSLLAIKKLADGLKRQGPRTLIGRTVRSYGLSPLSTAGDVGLRRGAWSLLNEKEE